MIRLEKRVLFMNIAANRLVIERPHTKIVARSPHYLNACARTQGGNVLRFGRRLFSNVRVPDDGETRRSNFRSARCSPLVRGSLGFQGQAIASYRTVDRPAGTGLVPSTSLSFCFSGATVCLPPLKVGIAWLDLIHWSFP